MNLTSVSLETDKPVFIGLDVHRTFFVATCLRDGLVAKRCRLPGTSEAVLHFIGRYFPQAKVFTCYEAGYSGFWLHRDLEAAGIKNLVINPGSLAVAQNDKVKTDKRDSLKMATQLAAGQLRGIRVPTPEVERARLIARTREQVARAKRRAQCQIRMRLHQFNLLPRHIERVITVQDVTDILDTLKDDELRSSIELLLEQWQFLAKQLKELDKEIRQHAESNPLEVTYRSVPGVGPLVARVLAYELGDMSQFKNERALFSYTGLTPGEYTTGGVIHRGHISRQGNPRLRHLLVEAAWKAVRKDPVLKEDFERISLKSGKKRAIVAIARRLVGRIRAALQAHVPFVVGHRKEVQSTSILQ